MKLPTGIKRLLASQPTEQLLVALEDARPRAALGDMTAIIERQGERLGAGWLHVTDGLIGCDRLLAAPLLGVPVPRSFRTPQTQRILDNGTFTHLRYYWYFRALPPPWEVAVAHLMKRWPLVGEADVVVAHPDLGRWVIELKTINSGQWRGLRGPQEAHSHQLNSYLGLLATDAAGQVWYENKNTQELKLFQHDFNGGEWAALWQRVSRVAYDVMEGGVPPLCDRCPDRQFCEDMITPTAAALQQLRQEAGHARG